MSIPLPPKHPGRTSAQIHRAYAKACAGVANNSVTSESLDECRRASPTEDAEVNSVDSDRGPPMFHAEDLDDTWAPPFSHPRMSSRPVSTTPSPRKADHMGRRLWPKETRSLLEMCEQGYQIQLGMKSHCRDTATALEQMAGSCESTVRDMLTQLEDTLKVLQTEAEKPVNLDWAPILTELSDRVQPTLISILENQEASSMRLEDRMQSCVAGFADKLKDSIENRTEAHTSEIRCLREEILTAQQGVADAQKSAHSSQEVLKIFQEEQLSLKAFVRESLQEVLERIESNQKHSNDLEPSVGNTFANVEANQDMLGRRMNEVHDKIHADVGQLFNEIGTLQKALHLPFVKPRRESLKEGYRAREFETQTDGGDAAEAGTQTDPLVPILPETPTRPKKKERVRRVAMKEKTSKVIGELPKGSSNLLLADEATKKRRMREELIKPQYNVANYYYDRGWAQWIAKSNTFENLTLFVILFNAVWIAVETDQNDQVFLVDSDLAFQIVENFFCTFFTVELSIRYMAFKRNIYCVKDFWFVFDLFLVLGMILETWVLSAFILATNLRHESGGVGNLSLLRMARLVKVCRMARMARVLRSVPELVMIVKGMGVAFRSVTFFVLLAFIILYVFSVALRHLTKDTLVGDRRFKTVPRAMSYLLLDGMLPLYAPIVNEVSADRPYLWPVMLFFVLLASITVLNMLVGVLTEVVRTVAAAEKEAMTVVHVTQQLRKVMWNFKHAEDLSQFKRTSTRRMSVVGLTSMPGWGKVGTGDEDLGNVSKQEFEDFLTRPDVGALLRDVGVDISGLLDMTEMVYEDPEKAAEGLTFADFVDIVLNLRGSNPATVKDIKEMLRIVKTEVSEARSHLHRQFLKEISDFRTDVTEQLIKMKDKDTDSDGSLYSKASQRSKTDASPKRQRSAEDPTASSSASCVRFSPHQIIGDSDDDDISELGE